MSRALHGINDTGDLQKSLYTTGWQNIRQTMVILKCMMMGAVSCNGVLMIPEGNCWREIMEVYGEE